MPDLSKILREYPRFSDLVQNSKPYRKLDFTENNADLMLRDLSETPVFSDYVFRELLSENTFNGIGGYAENRVIYRHRKHFTDSDKPRSIHLGIDIWTDAGEPVHSPLDGIVHSYAFNDHYGDYGPTIILAHQLSGVTFYTLYGHLSLESLKGIYEGKPIPAGENFAFIGPYPENGDWPPHLHFQVISDIGGYRGDFPGVSSVEEQDYYLALCPDPDLILRICEKLT